MFQKQKQLELFDHDILERTSQLAKPICASYKTRKTKSQMNVCCTNITHTRFFKVFIHNNKDQTHSGRKGIDTTTSNVNDKESRTLSCSFDHVKSTDKWLRFRWIDSEISHLSFHLFSVRCFISHAPTKLFIFIFFGHTTLQLKLSLFPIAKSTRQTSYNHVGFSHFLWTFGSFSALGSWDSFEILILLERLAILHFVRNLN